MKPGGILFVVDRDDVSDLVACLTSDFELIYREKNAQARVRDMRAFGLSSFVMIDGTAFVFKKR